MPGYPIRNVWGVACRKCRAPVGVRCRDLRAGRAGCMLFGRRTHRERAQDLRIARKDDRCPRRYMLSEPPPTGFQYTRPTGGTIQTINPGRIVLSTATSTTADVWKDWARTWTNLATVTMNTTDTISVWHDTMWNRWVVNNNTTTQTGYVTDEQVVRNDGTGDWWMRPVEWEVNRLYEQQWDRWTVLHDREVPTPEELQRREDEAQRRREEESRRALEVQQRREQYERERAMAHDRGLELLNLILTPDQRQERVERGTITVEGSDGGLFVVDTGYGGVHGNVYEVDAHGCQLGRVCIAPQMRVDGRALPLSDGWVGQILLIQTDEERFRQVGNWSGRRECAHRDVPILAEYTNVA